MANETTSLGTNIQSRYDDKSGILTLLVNTKATTGVSKSGKTNTYASTNGNRPIAVNGKVLYVSANLFEYVNPK